MGWYSSDRNGLVIKMVRKILFNNIYSVLIHLFLCLISFLAIFVVAERLGTSDMAVIYFLHAIIIPVLYFFGGFLILHDTKSFIHNAVSVSILIIVFPVVVLTLQATPLKIISSFLIAPFYTYMWLPFIAPLALIFLPSLFLFLGIIIKKKLRKK